MTTPSLHEISDALGRGAVVGMPTDTVYGIAADPRNPIAVGRLFSIKGRPEGKPVGLLVADLDSALGIVDLPDYAIEWARSFWPGPAQSGGGRQVRASRRGRRPGRGTVGVRVPDHRDDRGRS